MAIQTKDKLFLNKLKGSICFPLFCFFSFYSKAGYFACGFFISTPVGKYNPDWAIAFYEGKVKHIYFVAETKGTMSSMQLRTIEDAKIHCAREHFKSISTDDYIYDVVDSYDSLMNIVNS